MCILEPLDGGQKPSIEMVLEGRQFFVCEFSGVRTIRVAHITIEIHFQEYNVYYSAIRQRLKAPNRNGARGQALFRAWIFGGVHYRDGSYHC